MKKRDLSSLKLNKSKISSLKGGFHTPVDSDCSSFGNGECEDTYCNCETQNKR